MMDNSVYSDWPTPPTNAAPPALGLISAWFGVGLTAVTAVAHVTRQPGLASPLDPLLAVLSLGLMALLLASGLFWLLARQRRPAALPLIINLGTLLIVNTVPFGELWQDLVFRWRWRSYQAAAAVITAAPPAEQLATAEAAGLGYGAVAINHGDGHTYLFFYTEMPENGRFAGYYYRPDGLPPQPGDFGGQWREVRQQRPYWYYCVSQQ